MLSLIKVVRLWRDSGGVRGGLGSGWEADAVHAKLLLNLGRWELAIAEWRQVREKRSNYA